MPDSKPYDEMTNDELFNELGKCFKCNRLPECPVAEIKAIMLISIMKENGISTNEWKTKMSTLRTKTFGTKEPKRVKIEIQDH